MAVPVAPARRFWPGTLGMAKPARSGRAQQPLVCAGNAPALSAGTDLVRTGLDLAARQLLDWIAGGSLWLAVAMVTVPGFSGGAKQAGIRHWPRWRRGSLLSIPPNIGVFTRAETGVVTEKNIPLRLTPTQSGELVALALGGRTHPAVARARGLFFRPHAIRPTAAVARGR